jgi:Tol biopolymer transport system component
MRTTTTVLCLVLLAAAPAAAFHRQTEPIVQLTFSGDTSLPRLRAGGNRLAVAVDLNGSQIFRLTTDRKALSPLTTQGDNRNPSISSGGFIVAWDADCASVGCADPGRQIFMQVGNRVNQVTHDPTGTSVNPALSGRGRDMAFESNGDLAGLGDPPVPHIFVLGKTNLITRISRGLGASHNPVLNRLGHVVAFDSTTDPDTNADTGVAQIWLKRAKTAVAEPITHGAGPSRKPAISKDGHLVAFESRAALATDGHDTGKTQIFVYDVANDRFGQLTNEANGCSTPSVDDTASDYRVAYACDGKGYVHLVFAEQRSRLPIDVGDTAQVVAEPGVHFVVVTTTANLLGSGTTAGHQVYQLNLYKLPTVPAAGTITWFDAN